MADITKELKGVGVTLLALFGGLFVLNRLPSSAPAVSVETKRSPESDPHVHTTDAAAKLDDPLRTFLGVGSKVDQNNLQKDDKLRARVETYVARIDQLVVSVADPHETQVNYRYDFNIDAISKSLSAEGFVLTSFFLPWDSGEKSPLAGTQPGLLLFRRPAEDGAKTNLLFVYLVGEVPTSGIHKPAFTQAVEHFKSVRALMPTKSASGKIFVVGPVFSGSADSLAMAIAESKGNNLFLVVSGSANSVNAERFELVAKGKASFLTVLGSAQQMKLALIEQATKHRGGVTRMAWLTEFTTQFGTGLTAKAADLRDYPDLSLTEFVFPTSIARLREEYAEHDRAIQGDAQPPQRLRVAIPFGSTSSATDLPTVETPLMTTPTNELLLDQTISSLRSHRITHVGISATDIRDEIFLAQMIRRRCPEVQLLLASPDVLLLNPGYGGGLTGSLVASAYPMHPDAQDWCYPYNPRNSAKQYAIMGGQAYVGIFNAVRVLRGVQTNRFKLCGTSLTVDESAPENPLPLTYGGPLATSAAGRLVRPPIWISRVGIAGFYPVAVYPGVDGMGEPNVDPPNPLIGFDVGLDHDRTPMFNSHVPLSTRIMAGIWLLAATIFLTGMRLPSGNLLVPIVSVEGWPSEYIVFGRVFRAAMSGILICILLMFGALLSTPLVVHSEISNLEFTIDSLYCFATAGAIIFLSRAAWIDLCECSLRQSPSGSGRFGKFLVATRFFALAILLLTTGLTVTSIAIEATKFYAPPHVELLFWFTTWGDMWNGVSPLPAIQLVAGAAMILAYGMLLQLHLLQRDNAIPAPRWGRCEYSAVDIAELRADIMFPMTSRLSGRTYGEPTLDSGNIATSGAAAPRFGAATFAFLTLGFVWLAFLWMQSPTTDFFARPANVLFASLLMTFLLWFVRLIKTIEITRKFFRDLKGGKCGGPEVVHWRQEFTDAGVSLSGLRELLWSQRAKASDDHLRIARRQFEDARAFAIDRLIQTASLRLFAVEASLYIHQSMHHIVRLLTGLLASGFVLFVATAASPYNQQPLLRLTASCGMVVVASAVVWYYIKLDKHPVISALVGSEPNNIQVNWTLVQHIGPALSLVAIALANQFFPDIWQWLNEAMHTVQRPT